MKSIKSYNTYKVDHQVDHIYTIDNIVSLRQVLADHKDSIILGGGSNVLFTKDLKKPVLHILIKGINIDKVTESYTDVTIGAGESWHDLVLWALDNDLGGIENLSLIPGSCGAAPLQNIGAYGVELSDTLIGLRCMSRANGALIKMSKSDCKFGYRDSVFKNEYKNDYVITSMTLRLTNSGHHQINYSYGDISNQLKKSRIDYPSIQDISHIVIKIRNSKLPDPKQIPNAGSFFKNPVIPIIRYEQLNNKFPLLPSYPLTSGLCKIPAGWLVDKCGWKGVMVGDIGVHNRQALVIVNHGETNGNKIVGLSKLIKQSVVRKFGIELESEVNVL